MTEWTQDAEAGRLTMEKLDAMITNLLERSGDSPNYIILPILSGMRSADRWNRRVTLKNGMTLELPEGMHPIQFYTMGETEALAFILQRNDSQGIQKVGTLCGRFDVYRDIGGKNFEILPPEKVTKDPL